MIAVLIEPRMENNPTFVKRVAALKGLCQKKRIHYRRVRSLEAAAEQLRQRDEKSSLVIFANDTQWMTDIVNENTSRFGLPVIVAGYSNVPYHYSTFHSLSFDWYHALATVFNYLEQYGRTEIALFGIDPNIESHTAMANLLVQYFPTARSNAEQVFPIITGLNNTMRDFSRYMDGFDAIICPNDLTAIYLIDQFQKTAPERMHQLFIISMESSRLSDFYPVSLTSFADHSDVIVRHIIELNQRSSRDQSVGLHYQISGTLTVGRSTQMRPYRDSTHFTPLKFALSPGGSVSLAKPAVQITPDREYLDLRRLELLLQNCGDYELSLLVNILTGGDYDRIAEQMHTNIDTVKYYTRKLFSLAGLHSRRELETLILKYLTPDDLRRQIRSNVTDKQKRHTPPRKNHGTNE